MNESLDLDYEQIINLIQCLLSLEDCLQYQIIPLTLEQDCLTLGMVNPEDQTALDFIRSIVNALGYRLNIQHIDSYAHQLVLAAYLKHNHTVEQPKADVSSSQASAEIARDSPMTVVNTAFEPNQTRRQNELDYKATIIADLPEDLSIPNPSVEDSKSTVYAPFPEDSSQSDAFPQLLADLTKEQTLEPERVPEVQADHNLQQAKDSVLEPFLDFELSTLSGNYCLTHESINTLSPQQLWQELFTNILKGSISKLNLERNLNQGRILWSQDGIVQSSLDNVSLSILQALINEIKTLAKIPLEPLQKSKKVAINKHYQQERLQLRIDVCPSEWGDEINIQVLRGNSLKLYEQKQIAKMSAQALLLAQKLAKTLTTMRNSFDSSEIGDLSEIRNVQQEINRQLEL